ncbi:hypothetical protein CJ179_03670 [Rhodococcus sp. ACS1]|nr:hypothetical protein CJ179_03670 [Rhodococcus sp. ACS1]
MVTATTTFAGAVITPVPSTNATPDTPPIARQTPPANAVTTRTTGTVPSTLRGPITSRRPTAPCRCRGVDSVVGTLPPTAEVRGRWDPPRIGGPVTVCGDRLRRRDMEVAVRR